MYQRRCGGRSGGDRRAAGADRGCVAGDLGNWAHLMQRALTWDAAQNPNIQSRPAGTSNASQEGKPRRSKAW